MIPLRDRTALSAFSTLDRSFRLLGGAPTYVLTDNEKMTVTTIHVASARDVITDVEDLEAPPNRGTS